MGIDELLAPDWKPLTDVACPKCREPLFIAQYPGVNLYGCGKCGSAWLDNDGCRRLLGLIDPSLPDAVIGTVQTMDRMPNTDQIAQVGYRESARGLDGGPRLCPWCRVELSPHTVASIEVDACKDHGTFFEKRELVLLSGAMSKYRKQVDENPFLRDVEALSKRPPRR